MLFIHCSFVYKVVVLSGADAAFTQTHDVMFNSKYMLRIYIWLQQWEELKTMSTVIDSGKGIQIFF